MEQASPSVKDTNDWSGAWHHVVASVDSSTITLYIDGNNKGSTSFDGSIPTTSNSLKIGSGSAWQSDNPNHYFDGQIDEVKIYNFALTADQIKTEYNQGFSQVFGATSTDSSGNASWSSTNEYCPPGQGSACTPPVAEWKLDEKTGTNAYDTSGNGYTGTFGGSPTWRHAGACKFGACLQFGGSSDYIGASDQLVSAYPFTLSAWINTTTTVRDTVISLTDVSQSNVIYSLETNLTGNITIIAQNTTSQSVASTTTINDGSWHYITGVFASATDRKLFVDGVQENADTNNVTYAAGVDTWNIGRTGDSTPAGEFNGLIDQVRVYNTARTQAQIAWEYNRGGPVGWWKFDECSGTNAYDSSGNSNTGTITPGTGTPPQNTATGSCSSGNNYEMWNDGTTGKRNASLGFDGNDDYVNIGEDDLLDIHDEFSVSAWVYRNSASTNDVILAKDNNYATNTDAGYVLTISGSGDNARFYVTDGSNACTIFGTSLIDSPGWHHIAATYINSGNPSTAAIYVDGSLENDSPGGCYMTPANVPNALDVHIGSESDGGEPFDGLIDDVKIWRYTLTPQQIRNEYNAGAVRFGN